MLLTSPLATSIPSHTSSCSMTSAISSAALDTTKESVTSTITSGEGAQDRHPEEKEIIIRAAGAHCGEASDGTKDTLKELKSEVYFEQGKVRLREIATILRFADEMAEGPQRTSEFMRRTHRYAEKSQEFHDYAAGTRQH